MVRRDDERDPAQRWAPWLLGAVACAVHAVLGPQGASDAGGVWSAVAWLAESLPFGDPGARIAGAGAVCAGGAVVVLAHLVITAGGGGGAAIAGAGAAAAVMVAAGPWTDAVTLGPWALGSGLALGAIVLAERIAAGGGAWPGAGAGVVLGLAVAVDRAALVVAPGLIALWAIRARHGARWAVVAPFAGVAAWAVAMISVWRAGAGPAVAAADDARYAIELVDATGAIASVAGAVGLVLLIGRRRTRWVGGFAIAVVLGGVAVERVAGQAVGPLPIAGLALAAGIAVARLARLAGPPIGQACIGAAGAVIVAAPAVLAAL